MRIAVKYCGGCNPSVDRTELVGKLAVLLARERPDCRLVTLRENEYDAVLLVNGCPVACVEKQFQGEVRPVLLVAGETLQREPVAEQDLPAALAARITNLEGETPGKEGAS